MGRNGVPGRRNSLCKGPGVVLSLKKLGVSEELQKVKCSSQGLNSKSKPYSQPTSHPTKVNQYFSREPELG